MQSVEHILLNQLLKDIQHLMSTAQDLTNAVAQLQASVAALEAKIDTPNGPVDQPTLDAAVASITDATTRIDAETAKK